VTSEAGPHVTPRLRRCGAKLNAWRPTNYILLQDFARIKEFVESSMAAEEAALDKADLFVCHAAQQSSQRKNFELRLEYSRSQRFFCPNPEPNQTNSTRPPIPQEATSMKPPRSREAATMTPPTPREIIKKPERQEEPQRTYPTRERHQSSLSSCKPKERNRRN
jgi:hypothetical protein